MRQAAGIRSPLQRGRGAENPRPEAPSGRKKLYSERSTRTFLFRIVLIVNMIPISKKAG